MLPPLPVFQKAVAARQQSSNLLAQDSSSGDSLRLSSSSSPDLLSLVCTYTLFWNVRWLLHRSRVLPFCRVVPS